MSDITGWPARLVESAARSYKRYVDNGWIMNVAHTMAIADTVVSLWRYAAILKAERDKARAHAAFAETKRRIQISEACEREQGLWERHKAVLRDLDETKKERDKALGSALLHQHDLDAERKACHAAEVERDQARRFAERIYITGSGERPPWIK